MDKHGTEWIKRFSPFYRVDGDFEWGVGVIVIDDHSVFELRVADFDHPVRPVEHIDKIAQT